MNKKESILLNTDVMYYQPVWNCEPLSVKRNVVNQQTLVVLEADRDYVKELSDAGYHVVLVQIGDHFQELSRNVYKVNPKHADDYQQLVAAWKKQGIHPDKIIQLWHHHSQKTRDVDTAFYLIKALVVEGMKPWDWIYVYPNNENRCGQEAMAGFFHSLHAEDPQLKAKIVAVDKETGGIANQIIAEASIQEGAVVEVRYRTGERQVRRIQTLEKDYKGKGTISPSLIWRPNGVYIITGGAGSLGILTAEHIARKTRANIVLVGRSALSPEKEVKLENLRGKGSNVLYIQANIAKQKDTKQLINDVRSQFGQIHGVIHLAGCLHDGFLKSKQQQDFDEVLSVKIDGAYWLDKELEFEPLEMFILYSSLISLIGNAGQVDYAYANRYLDAFATRRAKQVEAGERQGITVSINWPLWQDGGMKVDERTREWMKKVMGIEPLSVTAGMEALETAVQSGLPQLAVLVGDQENVLSRKVESHVIKDNENKKVESSELSITDREQGLLIKTETYLKQVLSDEIKVPISKIKSNAALEDYGIDSVLVVSLTRQLEQEFGEISKTLFFEYQTIFELAQYFVTTYKEKLLSIFEVEKTDKIVNSDLEKQKSASTFNNKSKSLTSTRTKRIRNRNKRSSRNKISETSREMIAIVGVGGRYPQAKNLSEFWENLKQGKDCIREVPSERWDWREHYDPDKNKSGSIYTKWGGFLDDVYCFDPLFFNISPKEAELMDPQERLFLETAWHTLEDAGYTRRSLGTDKVGVFVGVMYGQYQMLGVEEGLKGNQVAPSSSYASIANRVSYFMNFHGPSMALDTMCSSSLTAIHLACDSIQKGESDAALVGGVNLSIHPSKYLFLSQGKFASTDGRCRSFGEGGDGYVPGEGTGAVLLKPLRKAIEDGDYIYGVIRGSSLNHGGKTNGYTVPNPQMQAELVSEALRKAEIEPSEVSYIEAHGTGTALGDPIEIAGLVKVFGESRNENQFCAIGSIKSNIGHLESAAGIAGLTKILLQMKHKKLVPSIHSEPLNPNINFSTSPFYVQRELSNWEQPVIQVNGEVKKLPRIAGISSFGAGGANAHIIIQEWDNHQMPLNKEAGKQLIILSARKQERLQDYVQQFIDFLKREKEELNLSDLAYTLQTGREVLAERLAFVVDDIEDLIVKLTQYIQGDLLIEDAYFGNQKKGPSDNILDSTIEAVMKERDWNKLAQYWMNGVDHIPWELLYAPGQQKRIPLPVYPFARERYWIKTAGSHKGINQTEVVNRLHPLLEQNTSTFEEQRFTTTFTGREFFVADHRVHNKQVLPGAAYIEMARAAGELSFNQPVKQIKNVVWESPIVVNRAENDSKQVSISLHPRHEQATFEVWTEDDQGERIIHAHGEVHYSNHDNQIVDMIDIEKVRSHCKTEWTGETCYQRFALNGLNYGETFQSLIRIIFSNEETLAELKMSNKVFADAEDYGLHPSLLDGAFQSVLGLMTEEIVAGTYLPYGIETLEIYHSLHDARYVYAKEVSNTHDNENEPRQADDRLFDLVITDQEGMVLAVIKKFEVHRSIFMKDSNIKSRTQVGLYYPSWKENRLESSSSRNFEGDILIFARDNVIFEQLKANLTKQHSKARVLLVQPGTAFRVKDENIYTIDITAKQDYFRLFQQLSDDGINLNYIIHLWSQTKVEYSQEGIKAGLDHSVYSLLYISQAMMTFKRNQTIDLTYIYREIEGQPLYAANSGWLKTLSEENPAFRCKVVAIDKDPVKLLDHLLLETHADRTTTEIRFTEGKRLVKEVQKLTNKSAHIQADLLNNKLLIGPNSNILITGGMGGLGLIFAKYLAQNAKEGVRLILTGRSPLTSDKSTQLRDIEQFGVEVEYRQVDVSNRHDVMKLIADIKKQYGSINGILHSAGVLRDGFVFNKQVANMEAVLAPKVYGTIWLEQATRNDHLDFFVLFSSLSAELGNPGQSDYAYANAFLDALAHQRKRDGQASNMVSLNWPLWFEGKMGVSQEVERLLEEKMPGLVPLSTVNGLTAFEKGLTSSEPQVIVIEGNEAGMNNLFASHTKKLPEESSVGNTGDHQEYLKELENYLKKMLSQETKLTTSQISAYEPLEAYGIDSVMVMNMTRVLEKDFGKLSKTLFFEYQTIQEMLDYFAMNHQTTLVELFSFSDANKQSILPKQVKESNTDLCKDEKPKRSRFIDEPRIEKQFNTKINNEEVAIIGLSGRYPMAENLQELWENLKVGKDCITEIPKERWNHERYFDSDKQKKGKTYSKWGGFMDDVDKFDPLVFNISPREAKQMDPQERLFLQTVWHTMEDAGYTKKELNKHQVGVFVGAMYAHYQMIGANQETVEQNIPASSFASIANRVSYFFNFHGPSIAIDTMCSSSLTAIHLACKSIQLGESDVAFAGGVNLSIHPHKYLLLGQGKFVSSDGRCRAFGEGGDGYVPGEGVGAVLLKPLRKAIQDGDQIYGVIKSSTVNHGGKTNGYSVPNPVAQAELLADALKKANVNPRHLSYIEAHGTGTALGDPIEITGLQKAFEPYTNDKGFCAIGSVKSNIGHLESAAGIAGLTKLLLQLKHKQLVSSIHTDTLNPHINFEDTPFYVQRELSEWKSKEYPRLAGLSSFGAGGSNAHLIVEEWVDEQAKSDRVEPVVEINASNYEPQLIILSAKNKKGLKQYARTMVDFLENQKRTITNNDNLSLPKPLINDVRQCIAEVADVNVMEIAYDDELTEYGFDQAMVAQLAQTLSHRIQMEVHEYMIYENNSLENLVEYLWETEKTALFNHYHATSQSNLPSTLNEPSLVDIAHTLQVGREAMEERLTVIVNSEESLCEKLQQYIEGKPSADLLQGTVKKGEQKLQLIGEDEDSQELVQKWVSKGKLDKLALLWINGVEIEWQQLRMSKNARRISLPVYPFARERYWIDNTERVKENYIFTDKSHPLIDKLDSRSSLRRPGIVFVKTISPQSAIVQDHRVQGEAMLPGAAYLEMVMEACHIVEPNRFFELQRVVWKKSIILSDPVDVRVILSGEGDIWNFEVQSSVGEEVITNASGHVIMKDLKQEQITLEQIQLTEIQERSIRKLEHQEIYRRFEALELRYGPYFQTMNRLWGNEKKALGQLELPKVFQQEEQSYILHPSILDGALQTILGISSNNEENKQILVPFAIEKMIYMDKLPLNVYSFVEQKQAMLYDITIVDNRGKVYVKLEGVSIRALTESNDSISTVNPVSATLIPIKDEEGMNLTEKQQNAPGELQPKVEQTIMDTLAQVLQIDLYEFDHHAAFTDFGVDSVLAVEIINRINDELDISLRTTDLFNYTSIRDLVDYIIDEFSDEISSIPNPVISIAEIEQEQYLEIASEQPTSISTNKNLAGNEEIAIVGMSGQFPGAKNLTEFWENLLKGVNTVRPVERWEEQDFFSPDHQQVDKSYSKWMGQLSDIDQFDPLFFNISPKEAEMIDPQHRIFLMEAWRALEDAGYTERASENQKCGVFVGCGTGDYMDMMKEEKVPPSAYAFMGNDESILPSRISYFLNLKGPSLAINTACSSSLVAIHLACESIKSGTSDMALAGGISILNTPRVHVLASRAGMLSPDGQCKAFDNSANGFVPSEGVGVVVLKPLKKALADGDHVYGVIKGSGINQDGKTNGITAPSAPSQTALELEVYKKYQINPADISYVEAHGTGTRLGDPIEIDALTDAFRKYTQEKQYCAIGSVKSNIGHALPAAGIAGLLKILLSLKHKKIAPSLLMDNENEHIKFHQSPFYVNMQLRDWQPRQGKKRLSAISSFGFSGTNAHMVIEEAPDVYSAIDEPYQAYLIPISAKTESALQNRIQELYDFLQQEENTHVPLHNLAYTLHMGRSHFAIRAAFVTSSIEELRTQLQRALTSEDSTEFKQHNLERNPIQYIPDKKQQGEELIIQIANNSRELSDFRRVLSILTDLYLQGYDLSWKQLYANASYQRLSLPTYPFNLQRCWIPNVTSTRQEQSRVMEKRNQETFQPQHRVVLRKTISENDPIVRDHRIANEKLYPGVGYLQLAYEAMQVAGYTINAGLSNVLWLQPLVVEKGAVELEVSIHTDKQRTYYEVKSDLNGKYIVHSKGEFKPLVVSVQDRAQESLQVKEIQQRCTPVFSKKELYQRLTLIGMHYGPYFQGVKQIWSNDNEALGHLQLKTTYAHELTTMPLHPCLMDAALHTISGLTESDQPLLPFAVDHVEVHRPLEAEGYAYATRAGKNRYDVTMTDSDGFVCIKLFGVTLVADKKRTIYKQDFYYRPYWMENQLPSIADSVDETDQKLLFVHPPNTAGLQSALAAEHPSAEVFRIQFGEKTRQHSSNVWEIDPFDNNAFDRILSGWKQMDKIYFMGGIQTSNSMADLKELEKSQQTGVLSLFRLVKVLGRYSNSLTLKVITNNIFPVPSGDEVCPASASLHGFTKSLANEYPSWKVKLIDISLQNTGIETDVNSLSKLAEAIVVEPADKEDTEVAIRHGKRYSQRLESVQLPPVNNFPFKRNGCYLILGGAGGIGMELSKYISQQVQANLVLIGRSPLDEKRKQMLKEIKANGSEVLYLQADALNLTSMEQAISKAKDKFGKIDGAIHSAIVLRDRIIANMDEYDLRAALDAKVQGSYILHSVLANESLDFMLFFSSAQSFSGNPGQSNYSAGCTFKDAFAQYLMQTEEYPVRIINWGYWGTVGIVSSDDYNKRLAAQGVQSILPTEGMEAVVRVLSNRLQQVVPFKAEKNLLKKLGFDIEHTVTVFQDCQSSLNKAEIISKTPIMEPARVNHNKIAFKKLAEFGSLLLLKTYKQLGAWHQEGEEDQLDTLQKRLSIVPKYRRFLSASIDMLQNAGFVEKRGNIIISTSKVNAPDVLQQLNQLEVSKEELATKYPEIQAHLNLLWTCYSRYSNIFTGLVPATDIMFPNSSMELVENIYRNNEVADYYNQLVVRSVQTYLQHTLKVMNGKRKIKILEIGAGTGGTSAHIFEGIRPYAEHLHYVYTDISTGFTHYGKRKFGRDNPYVEFQILDIEKDVVEQGFNLGEYDIILATNVLHATRNLANTLQHIKNLLKTNGWLIINETTQVHDFATLTFGLLDGWWLYEDKLNRLPNSPLIHPFTWEHICKNIGYEQVQILGELGLGQNVIIAESNGIIRQDTDKVGPVHDSFYQLASAPESKVEVQSQKIVVETTKEEQNRFERIQYIEQLIRSSMKEKLGINDIDIQQDKDFSAYGVDSISGVNFISYINDQLGIALRTTVLFDYKTVNELVQYIYEQYNEQLVEIHAERTELIKDSDTQYHKESIAHVDDSQLDSYIIDKVVRSIEETLGIEADTIHLEKSFSDYGIDSISGVNLINTINEHLGILLRTTTLFDYSNVKELSLYIKAQHGQQLKEALDDVELEASQASVSITISKEDLLRKLAKGELSTNEVISLWR